MYNIALNNNDDETKMFYITQIGDESWSKTFLWRVKNCGQ